MYLVMTHIPNPIRWAKITRCSEARSMDKEENPGRDMVNYDKYQYVINRRRIIVSQFGMPFATA